MSSFPFECDSCDLKLATATSEIVFHHVKQHELERPFYCRCQEPNCNNVFTAYSTYRRHWYRIHRNQTPLLAPEDPNPAVIATDGIAGTLYTTRVPLYDT